MKDILRLFACNLLDRVSARRKALCNDMVAEVLEEIVDALSKAIRELPDDDIIISHLQTHSDDYTPRQTPSPIEPKYPPLFW